MSKGGYRIGAGRPGRDAKVEDCRRLDIRAMQKAGLFRRPSTGTWRWLSATTGAVTASVSVDASTQHLRLSYHCDQRPMNETIPLVPVSCGFGGHRQMFVCLGCKSKRSILLLRYRVFRCRQCHDLAYTSQSEDGIGRTWLAQAKLERSLTTDRKRPKGMHNRTYQNIRSEVGAFELLRDDLMGELLEGWKQ